MIKNFFNYILTLFFRTIGLISVVLSIRSRNRLGKLLGNFMRILSSKRRNITLANIKESFPEKSEKWHIRIMKEAYWNLGITFAELLAMKYFKRKNFEDYVKYENFELFEQLYSKGKGLILLSGHFGNWEMMAYTIGLFTNTSVTIIVKPQKNKYADAYLNKIRINGGNKVVDMYKAAKTIIKTLSTGGAIALLADQSASKDKDIFVDFFGRKASTFESPAVLALRSGTPVIMGFAVRQDDCTYRVQLSQLKTDDLEHNNEGVRRFTERHVKELEKEIRLNPGLWAWQHRRWKHTPEQDRL